MTRSPQDVTQLLLAWRNGDQAALDQLISLVYEELRQIAKRVMAGEGPGHTLQPTALVHEAYERLIHQQHIEWQNRAHFFAISARIMRRWLVDHARRRHDKRLQVTLGEAVLVSPEREVDVLTLDEALSRLAALDPRKSQLVELRYFGGLTHEEIAEVLGISVVTVNRELRKAKAWLYHELSKTVMSNQ